MEYQLQFASDNLGQPTIKGQPDDEAIKMLREFEPLALERDPRGYCVCTSEGKDSRVLGHLFRRAGVKHFYLHNITGIDPPELVYFQRRNFAEYEAAGYLTYDVPYRQSMWALMLRHLLPPLRQMRYCCEQFKERKSPEQGNAIISLGVRKYESVRRAKSRDELESGTYGSKAGVKIYSYDDSGKRRMVEMCQLRAEIRINPLAHWPDSYIWDYSRDAGLEQCGLYAEGFDRLGCIGCPKSGECQLRQEFERWPKYRDIYIAAFDRMLAARRAKGMQTTSKSGEEWFEHWITGGKMAEPDEMQLSMEDAT